MSAKIYTQAVSGVTTSRSKTVLRAVVATKRNPSVEDVIARVKNRDGLCSYTPNIEYLVGGSNSTGWLDISDKTELILQSGHPVRYLVEREIHDMNDDTSSCSLKYLDWVTLFGRSLLGTRQKRDFDHHEDLKKSYEDQLANISRASECGMFSAEVHQTVLNIGPTLPPSHHVELNLGNKYAVLVGDFFAIKTIFFAEKVKSSRAFLEIIHGVEEFAYSGFNSGLIDKRPGYNIVPSVSASVQDWMTHAVESSGYFTGGLKAAFTLSDCNNNESNSRKSGEIRTFVSQLAMYLKAKRDSWSFHNECAGLNHCSPFLLVSLPAVLYQQKHPHLFHRAREAKYEDLQTRTEEICQEIAASSAISETQELIGEFATSAIRSINKFGKDEFYVEVIQQLLTNQ